jgi:hypothetical protein
MAALRSWFCNGSIILGSGGAQAREVRPMNAGFFQFLCKFWRGVFFPIAIVVLSLSQISQAGLVCHQAQSDLASVPMSELKQRVFEVLSQNVEKLPQLRGELDTLFAQDDLPVPIQKLLWRALKDEDVEINPLTNEDKKQFGFDMTLTGYAYWKKSPVLVERKDPGTFNSRLTDPIDRHIKALHGSAFLRDYVIFGPNTKPQWTKYNSLLTIYHELAHVRFSKLLERNPDLLLRGQFPEDLVRQDAETGAVIIDGSLFDYLQERYAFESEFRLLKYLKRKRILYGANPPNWLDFAASGESKEMLRSLARQIRSNYKILGDHRIAALDRRRLYDILLNGFGRP